MSNRDYTAKHVYIQVYATHKRNGCYAVLATPHVWYHLHYGAESMRAVSRKVYEQTQVPELPRKCEDWEQYGKQERL